MYHWIFVWIYVHARFILLTLNLSLYLLRHLLKVFFGYGPELGPVTRIIILSKCNLYILSIEVHNREILLIYKAASEYSASKISVASYDFLALNHKHWKEDSRIMNTHITNLPPFPCLFFAAYCSCINIHWTYTIVLWFVTRDCTVFVYSLFIFIFVTIVFFSITP